MKNQKAFATLISLISILTLGVFAVGASEQNLYDDESSALGTALPQYYASYYGDVEFSQNENVAMNMPAALGTALPQYYASYYGDVEFSQNENVAMNTPATLGTALPQYYASLYGNVEFNQEQIAQLENAEGGLDID